MYVRELAGGRAAKAVRARGFSAKAMSQGMTDVEDVPPSCACKRAGTMVLRGGLLTKSLQRASTSAGSTLAEGGQVNVIEKKEEMTSSRRSSFRW